MTKQHRPTSFAAFVLLLPMTIFSSSSSVNDSFFHKDSSPSSMFLLPDLTQRSSHTLLQGIGPYKTLTAFTCTRALFFPFFFFYYNLIYMNETYLSADLVSDEGTLIGSLEHP